MSIIESDTYSNVRPIYSWCDYIDEDTMDQIVNMSNCNNVFSHVCVMADAHLGYGIPIGGVLPVEDIILPYAVGNDIGCFTGDTKIPLLDGTIKTFKEQLNKEFWIYSIDNENKIIPGFAKCIKTRENTDLVEVEIDNGKKIRCTPDHLFKMRNGEYKEAQYLKQDDSLMPFYRTYQKKDGYEILHNPDNHYTLTHKKVINVKFLNEKEDVYCLQVNNEFHNFALEAGVFVHNCGCISTKLSYLWQNLTPELINRIMKEIVLSIPHGKGIGHRIEQKWDGFNRAPEFPTYIESALETARYQLGSLGAGNHFISLLKGDDNHTWLMIHSGSRNLGANICTEFYHRAKNFCSDNRIEVPSTQLSYLPLYSYDGIWYFDMMNFSLDFAKENRHRMMTICESIACGMLGCDIEQEIDIHHNYANLEVHNDVNGNGRKEVLIHRKGATSAFKGQLGIIPGSMGTSSYIVEGLGNELSFCTVSHGAGRAMSRKQAKKQFKAEDTKKLLNGIWFNHIALDEDPRCYKDINQVIYAQSDLVKPVVKLDPLGCIIGT